ncbi:hypothetical protein [Leptospira neocaledonica]|uniref:Membrane-binding protein n=1 Tax=Leptospira neocaledonica TaxID=2023192 RepID=A0A2N0A0M2_9LEPT|nr:hypothetical protein [Leptospira neocaledonica]PJZ77713.1 hypothetical protein CH365_09170 [Leptospira neocaledonica]
MEIMKFLFLNIIIVISSCDIANFKTGNDRPTGVDPRALWIEKGLNGNGYWHLEKKEGKTTIYQSWLAGGNLHSEVVQQGNIRYSKIYHNNGNLQEKGSYLYGPVFDEISNTTEDGFSPFGLWVEYYENGKIHIISCHTPDIYESIGTKCGLELEYSEDGKVIRHFDFKRKCKKGCDGNAEHRQK